MLQEACYCCTLNTADVLAGAHCTSVRVLGVAVGVQGKIQNLKEESRGHKEPCLSLTPTFAKPCTHFSVF